MDHPLPPARQTRQLQHPPRILLRTTAVHRPARLLRRHRLPQQALHQRTVSQPLSQHLSRPATTKIRTRIALPLAHLPAPLTTTTTTTMATVPQQAALVTMLLPPTTTARIARLRVAPTLNPKQLPPALLHPPASTLPSPLLPPLPRQPERACFLLHQRLKLAPKQLPAPPQPL